ncbi:hypothetical protein AVEN_127417-1 [Araneus ventricosus]|uniref:Uncharacterized protein n=1 Tax=Araneus ventricosus TaxID=182803 RepID=A0A4Y2MI55_ARAVE|nr:hypothetical protein AVEN_127417-1 [Araneus ventricosus]
MIEAVMENICSLIATEQTDGKDPNLAHFVCRNYQISSEYDPGVGDASGHRGNVEDGCLGNTERARASLQLGRSLQEREHRLIGKNEKNVLQTPHTYI